MYQETWDRITGAAGVVLISHVNPDGDALGSSLSLYGVLQRMGRRVAVVNVTAPLPAKLDFLPHIGKIKRTLPAGFDLIVAFDCGSFDRLGIERPKGIGLVNIDHHGSNTRYGDVNLIEPDAASTSQVVYRMLCRVGAPIDRDTAVCLYTALVEDTGFFRYESVTPEVFAMAGDLCRRGANPGEIARMLTERNPLAKLRLTAAALGTLRLLRGGTAGCVTVTRAMFDASGAAVADSDELVGAVRSLATVTTAIVLREETDGRIKVSLRTKHPVDAAAIAAAFDGGGHLRAAGFDLPRGDGTVAEAMDRAVITILEQIERMYG